MVAIVKVPLLGETATKNFAFGVNKQNGNTPITKDGSRPFVRSATTQSKDHRRHVNGLWIQAPAAVW